MEKINGYWIDVNDNKWDEKIFTKDEVLRCSESLIDCKFCYDCSNCNGCIYCSNCTDCSNCKFCNGCDGCYDCSHCNDCKYCNNCDGCYDGCKYCGYCKNCIKYITQPQIYITDRIGSRNDKTRFYYGKIKDCDNNTIDNLQVACGCFRGNLEEFEQAVRETHKNNEVYRNQYLKEIEKVKVLFKLEDK